MAIDLLRLHNVRNYAGGEFRPDPSTTVVWGPNGSGKSTLLEAIGLFSTLGSPRTAQLSALVSHGESEGGVRLETTDATPLEVRIRAGRALLRAGGSGVHAKDFLGRFRAVLFGPEDLDMVRGEPELRRRALDDLLVQARPAHRAAKQAYDRALRQRNAALRNGHEQQARVYHAPLAAAAAQVVDARRRVVASLEPLSVSLYDELAGAGRLVIRYRCTADDQGLEGEALVDHLLAAYDRDLPVELERGMTRIGPHRDDLDLELDGHPARAFASRGEQRTVALALRLAELRLLSGSVLLLDDVMSELDPDRRRRVFKAVGGAQTIVTATEAEAIPEGVGVAATWTVQDGVLRAA
ncbi:MAG TPA: DNA replication and repair protein RecF [Actinomycetota bacterium]|nr:DNA replication and repair protein RecF [Actinomycetota bacterium]